MTGLPDGLHELVVRVTGKKNPESVRTKTGLGSMAVFQIIATDPVEFNVDGVLGLDNLESW